MRALILGRCHWALLLIALALCVKAVLPAGYMIATSPTTALTLTLCNSGTDGAATTTIEIPAKGSTQDRHDGAGKADGQCSYSSLAMAATGGAPAPLLALAFAFIILLGLAPAKHLPFRRISHLRPPLRGPPATA